MDYFRSSCLTSVGDSDFAVSPLRHLAQDVGLNNASNITEVKIILLADLVPDFNHFSIKEIESLERLSTAASASIFFLTPNWLQLGLPSALRLTWSQAHLGQACFQLRGECMQECAMCLSASRTNGWWHSHPLLLVQMPTTGPAWPSYPPSHLALPPAKPVPQCQKASPAQYPDFATIYWYRIYQ